VVLNMRALKDMKDCYGHTCAHRDSTCAYRVTCDDAQSRRDELCFPVSLILPHV
jgi:hypothetical protein